MSNCGILQFNTVKGSTPALGTKRSSASVVRSKG